MKSVKKESKESTCIFCNIFFFYCRLTERVGTKFLSEEKKNLLQKLSTIYFEGAAREDVDAADNFKSVKGNHVHREVHCILG